MSDSEKEVGSLLWPLSEGARSSKWLPPSIFAHAPSISEWHAVQRYQSRFGCSTVAQSRRRSRGRLRHTLIFFPLYLTAVLFLTRLATVALQTGPRLYELAFVSYRDDQAHGFPSANPEMTGNTPDISEYIRIQQEVSNVLSIHGPGLKVLSKRLCKMEWDFTKLPPTEEYPLFFHLAANNIHQIRLHSHILTLDLLRAGNYLLSADARLLEQLDDFTCAIRSVISSEDSNQCGFVLLPRPEDLVEMAAETFPIYLKSMEVVFVQDFDMLSDSPTRGLLSRYFQSAVQSLQEIEQLVLQDVPDSETDTEHKGGASWGSWFNFSRKGNHDSSIQARPEPASIAIVKETRFFLETLQKYIESVFTSIEYIRSRVRDMEHKPVPISGLGDFEKYLWENRESLTETARLLWDEIDGVVGNRAWVEQHCMWSPTVSEPLAESILPIADNHHKDGQRDL